MIDNTWSRKKFAAALVKVAADHQDSRYIIKQVEVYVRSLTPGSEKRLAAAKLEAMKLLHDHKR